MALFFYHLTMSKRLAKKILLIGWDAADWRVIMPLLDAGKMPALDHFINQGVMGNIATLTPALSPMLWTSIATGMRPFKHGIHGFTEPDPNTGAIRPVTSTSRKVKAIWNILNQNGYRSNVIGWWPSHPTEPINGVMVSNLYQRARAPMDKPWPMLPGTVHPRSLTKNIARLRIHPGELTEHQILPFIPRAAEIDQEKDKRLQSVARILADCSTIHACTTAVMQLEPWDFMAVYYDAIDHFGHGFMRYHPPRQKHIKEEDFELYKDVVEAGYRFHDMILGVLLKLAGEDTTVMLISDHGFHPDHLRPARIPHEPAGPAVEHRHYGIFVMKGPEIRQDERIYGASLLDITPTILTLFGLPVGEDMDGKPLIQGFEEFVNIDTIPSWEEVEGDAGMHPPDQHIDPVEAREVIKQLVALGYIEDPGDDREEAVRKTIWEDRYNLARSYMDANRHAEAVPILEELWAADSEQLRFANQLAACYMVLKRLEECRNLIETAIRVRRRLAKEAREKLKEYSEKKELKDQEKREVGRLRALARMSTYWFDYTMGSLLFGEEKPEAALEHLRRAEKAKPHLPNLHIRIGHIFLRMKRWPDAERAFSQALEIDPDNAEAHLGLCMSFLPQSRNLDAANEALAAIGLLYHYPEAHYRLGIALHRVGFIDRAIEALQVALSQNPNFPEAHRRLAYIYKNRLKDLDTAEYHQRLAKALIRMRRQKRKMQVRSEVDVSSIPGITEPAPPTIPADVKSQVFPESPEQIPIEADGDERFITIVSGLPRSGTSMMMQMLSSGGYECLTDDLRKADDDNPRGYYEYEKVKQLRKDRSWLPEARGKAVKIIAQLLPSLPGKLPYRIIYLERDLKEVIASQNRMLERQGQKGARLSKERLMQVFSQQASQTKRLLANRKIKTLYVNYQDALSQPKIVAQRLKAFLGVELDEEAMARAVDGTLYRQRRKNLS
ncbi:alkaline phosphatase family protein [Thermodesulfobacteriota bacterium]